jgi:hypothetical protein
VRFVRRTRLARARAIVAPQAFCERVRGCRRDEMTDGALYNGLRRQTRRCGVKWGWRVVRRSTSELLRLRAWAAGHRPQAWACTYAARWNVISNERWTLGGAAASAWCG